MRKHWIFASIVGVAALLRILVGVAYGPAFWFPDTEGYFAAAEAVEPAGIRPYGYSLLINLLSWTGSVWTLISLQHLIGIACGIAVYIFVLHKGGPQWLAIVASLPLLFDAHELVIEHYVLADTLFTALLLAGLMTLTWQDKLTIPFAIASGLLLAGAIMTRSVGLPIVILVGLYVLIRRVGWRKIAALAAAAGIPLLGYMVWFEHYNGAYGFSVWQDRWMYGRVMSIADCDSLDLNPNERKLCQRPEDPALEKDVNFYVWSRDSPVNNARELEITRRDSYTFIGKVIAQQPLDFAALVAQETWAYFSPQFYLNRTEPVGTTCAGLWELQSTVSNEKCSPRPVDSAAFRNDPGEHHDNWPGALPSFFAAYSKYVVTPGPFLLLGLGVVLVAAVRRGSRNARLTGDALFWGGCGLALIVGAVATSQFDIRYGLPSLALIPIAGALAWASLRKVKQCPSTQPLRTKPPTDARAEAVLTPASTSSPS